MNLKGVYNLNTDRRRTHLGTVLALLLIVLLSLVGCGKKCQQSTSAYTSVSDTPWRLVETNDKSTAFRKLNNYSFPILTFGLDFTGDMKTVANNQQFDNPICAIAYKTADGEMAVKYTEGGGGETLGGDAPTTPTEPLCPFSGTHKYEYKLGRELSLTDTKTGKFYRFVAFQGIVQPDLQCTF